MRSLVPGLVLFALALQLPAQEPVLEAVEAGAVLAARDWQRQVADGAEEPSAWARGFEVRYFGFDAEGSSRSSDQHRFGDEWCSVAVLWPQYDTMVAARPVLATSLGHVLLGPRLEPRTAWSPTLESVTGQGVEVRLQNMLLQSGEAADGTLWQRIDHEAGAWPLRQRVRVTGLADRYAVCTAVELGAPRFPWHPAWLPVDHLPVVAMHEALQKRGPATWLAEGDGVPARGLRLGLHGCGFGVVLRPDDVKLAGDELVVTARAEAVVAQSILDRQAWAAEALRRLCRYQLAARAAVAIDRDGDGQGEFGPADLVVPASQRRYEQLSNGRQLFEHHLFEVHVPADPDAAERGFVAYAWPMAQRERHAQAFFVDERGVVHGCDAAGRFGGHDHAPAVDVRRDPALGWRPLR